MAIKEICDKCGKESPDIEGRHIANKWYELVVEPRRERNVYTDKRRKVLLCKNCFEGTGIKECNWEYYK